MAEIVDAGQDQTNFHDLGPHAAEEDGDLSGSDWAPPPIYELRGFGKYAESIITAQDDGRLLIKLHTARKISLPKPSIPIEKERLRPKSQNKNSIPPLNIVIQIVGSRGDVQPFLALGSELRSQGHRVRIATHNVFRGFVTDTGLEFFPIGGDPSSLMAYMVNNPSIIPKIKTVMAGEIGKKRKMIYDMLNGCWRSCIEPDPVTNVPFVADAIIANPPSFAHIHCAQALGVPLHLMFTMPWSPTKAFPHPLANIERSDADLHTTNYLSYGLVEMMTWQGLADIFNKWRQETLSLAPLPLTVGPILAQYLQVPFTYCWSAAFVPKPADWPSYIDVCGFFFREEPDYTPYAELERFLQDGPSPIYIGFGSIVMEDATHMTEILMSAVRACGVRAIISRGWSKLGAGQQNSEILFLDDCPHEWLFKHVTCVVHHGGAGTTACGLLNGCPTAIVPFFGDQSFWGQMIAAANAGPQPIPNKTLNDGNLASAIRFCLTPQAREAAAAISRKMKLEIGVKVAVQSFNKNLPVDAMCCEILPSEAAVWAYKRKKRTLRLSDTAAFLLMEQQKIETKNLHRYQSKETHIDNIRWDPLSAGIAVLLDTAMSFSSGFAEVFAGPVKALASPGGGAHSKGANAGISVGKGFGKMVAALPKATLVDMPLALAEGFRQMPRLYGEDVRDNGRVTGWKSGGVVAGKTFAAGFYDGLSGVVVKPYQGAKIDGRAGFSKGLAKGSAGLLSGAGAGVLGLLAYPLLGVYKSLGKLAMSSTQKEILLARQVFGSYKARQRELEVKSDESAAAATRKFVLDEFEKKMGKE